MMLMKPTLHYVHNCNVLCDCEEIQDCNIISSCNVLSCGFENWFSLYSLLELDEQQVTALKKGN